MSVPPHRANVGPPGGPAPDPTPDPLLGQLLGERYRIAGLLARGGMARVYRARDARLGRDVAVKVLSRPYADSPDFARRFLAEARAAASLSHPNLVHVYDSGSEGELRYIVMELLEGYRSLRAEIAERERLPTADAVRIAREVLAGLQVVHAHGLLHCDVKAGNVMVGTGPTKLIDFGIARAPHSVTPDGTSLGSLHAMAPEQLRGEELTAATDLFAVGVVLYVALTGRVPFAGRDPAEVASAQETGRPVAPSHLVPGIDPRLDRAVLQALETEPTARFGSAAAMSEALAAASADAEPELPMADETTQLVRVARRPLRPGVGGPHRRSGVPLLLAATLVLAGLLLAIGLALTRGPGGSTSPAVPGAARESPAQPTPSLAVGKARVPQTIGLTEQQGEALSRAAGLQWTIRWQVAADRRPGIYDQQPSAGTIVDSGSQFTMFAYRSPD